MTDGIISRFDQLSASQRARLTPTGELRAGVGMLTRVVERTPPSAPPLIVTDPEPLGGAIDLGAGDALTTTV